ncbi:glycosyltransferase family 4 protein [Halobellus captivus]|uniref:glycosyltransferase family 4 protein n=1 Tax=Halobellus captivus TaxID=2592614 RepID=UPI0011A1290C|nr:glycosyltransferase family 4 protein [Halobellus captivus]
MRTLHLVTTESPFFEKQIQALEERGVSCTVVSMPKRGETARSVLSYGSFYSRVLQSAMDDFDIVHANYGLVGPFALAQPNRPVVLTLWGSEVMGSSRWLDALSAWTARQCDAVVAPSPAIAARLDCDHHLVPFGVDTDLFEPIPQHEAREQVGWDPDEHVVLFPYPPRRTVKNYPLAERVVAQLPDNVVLKTMWGVPYEKVPVYMNASDTVLVTSRRESGPMVVKEATACGVPVVSTDVGFVADVLEDVPQSFVCSSEAELVEGLRAALTAETSESPSREITHDLDRMGDQLLRVYHDVLDNSTEGTRVRT